MASEELTLHSQAVRYFNGGDNRVTTGTLFAGDTGSFPGFETASAMRFQLPDDFGGGETINEATLNIRAFVDDGMGHGDGIKVRLRILADTDQSLPATADGIRDASGGSQQKTIGWGTYSPAIDYVLTTTPATTAIDLTAAFSEAASDGRLSGGWVVVLMQAMDYGEYVGVQVSGIGTADEPTIDLNYSEGGSPLDEIAEAEDGQTLSEGDEPQPTFEWLATPEAGQSQSESSEPQPVSNWLASLEDAGTASESSAPQTVAHLTLDSPEASQARSEGDLPAIFVDAGPIESETRSQGDSPQPHVTGYPQAGQTRSLANSPQPVSFWTATAAHSQTASQAEGPQVSLDEESGELVARCNCLFPSDLFPHDLMV